MAEFTSNDSAPVVAAPVPQESFIKRELGGASFLSLEHAGHMALVVLVTALICAGINAALSLWTGGASTMGTIANLGAVLGSSKQFEAMSAIGLVAALLILVPLLVVLDRRTRAEWVKRPGYSHRLAYKIPVYGALAVLFAGKVGAEITMVSVILTSLAMIGVPAADFGNLYLTQFVPALIMAVVFGASAWYVFKLAKGHDMGRMFSGLLAAVGAVLVLALFITAVLTLHTDNDSQRAVPTSPYSTPDSDSLEKLFNY